MEDDGEDEIKFTDVFLMKSKWWLNLEIIPIYETFKIWISHV